MGPGARVDGFAIPDAHCPIQDDIPWKRDARIRGSS